MAKSTTKRRPKKSTKGLNGRLKTYIILSLVTLGLVGLFVLSFSHFYSVTPKQNETIIVNENIQKLSQNETKSENNKQNFKKNISFSKDENLTKIFTDPKSKDETVALSTQTQNKQQKTQSDKNVQKEQTKIIYKSQQNPEKSKQELKIPEIKKEQISPSKDKIIIADTNVSKKPKFENNNTNKTEQENIIKPTITQEKQDSNISKEKPKQNQKESKKESKQQKKDIKKHIKGEKPKLVIIIDDVATKEHVKMIQKTGLKLTPSFFPKTTASPNTPSLARDFQFYMIHLPLQAKFDKNPMPTTIKTDESYDSIDKKISQIKQDFKNVKYINNHTGSKFTSNQTAMDRLYKALNKYGFIFVDSRTSADTQVPIIAKKYNNPYISRDIFLDDSNELQNIKAQLDNAIAKAKKYGYAIAIAHPRKNTMQIINQNKDHIIKNVDVVYLNEIIKYYE